MLSHQVPEALVEEDEAPVCEDKEVKPVFTVLIHVPYHPKIRSELFIMSKFLQKRIIFLFGTKLLLSVFDLIQNSTSLCS